MKIQRNLDLPEAGNVQAPIVEAPITVDFDALSRPEGAPNLDGPDLTSLPNLDPPATVDPLITTPTGFNGQQQQQQQVQVPGADNDPFPFKGITTAESKALIERLANKYGENFQLPEDVNEENLFEHVENAIRPKNDLHPEVLKIDAALKSGANFETVVKGYNQLTDIKSLPNKELVTGSLKSSYGKSEKNPNGWDDAKIADMVGKMEATGMMDIEAEKIRHNIDQQQTNYLSEIKNRQETDRATNLQQMNVERESEIRNTLTTFSKMNDIFGIPLTQSEKAEFAEDLKYLVTPDDSGAAPVLQWLQSNDNLAKVAFLMKKGDAKVKEALLNAKNGVKNKFINKLDTEPKLTQKTTPLITPEIDMDALSRPANN
jgi:hypothetical protein